METRTYKEIIKDIRSFSSENTQLSEEKKAQLNKCADELESKTKDNRFIVLIIFILLIGSTVMWFLSSIENDDLKYDLQYKKSLIESYEKIIRFENDSTHSFTYRTKDGIPITYQELMDENYELLNKNSSLEYQLKMRDIYLDVIRDNYGIRIKERNNQIWAEGEKVDSALLLLNLYRDKIKYDPQTKTWSVTR
ncbi:MAG: hypothetical protein J5524_03715 [Bacteroidaceae bacterium]|nr:hypothetical protein [Bacteroidaceae bacterium]